MISLSIVSSLTVTNRGEIFCFVFTVNKDFFIIILKCFSLQSYELQPGFRRLQDHTGMELSRLPVQYNQNFHTNRSALWEWENSIVFLPVQFLTFLAWPSKRRVPQIWWGLCEVDPGGEILTSAGSIFHLKSLETDLQIISKGCSFYQMVVGWRSFTTDLGQTWIRDQEMKGSISHYQ